eukprot:CAMPEP_0177705214 /NCGR_PEP_ID=MMETSP0484_2-20121128/8590_1 /TAXON_ID=354590 /ORGANISM="Rhodomonas lens, Strain RHODO" /LENGTH=580 /DNA_ID=CAMNT_0019216629 /DNA_START=419 /DNA_END=2161 /DNA_ORIENTATION=+
MTAAQLQTDGGLEHPEALQVERCRAAANTTAGVLYAVFGVVGSNAPLFADLITSVQSLRSVRGGDLLGVTVILSQPLAAWEEAAPQALLRLRSLQVLLLHLPPEAKEEREDHRFKLLAMKASPYQRTLLLDADTVVCSGLGGFFMLLDRFDLAATHAPYLFHENEPPRALQLAGEHGPALPAVDLVPDEFVQMNTAVVLFALNKRITRMLNYAISIAPQFHANGFLDQAVLRQALWVSTDVQAHWLTGQWQCRNAESCADSVAVQAVSSFGSDVWHPCRILHTKNLRWQAAKDGAERGGAAECGGEGELCVRSTAGLWEGGGQDEGGERHGESGMEGEARGEESEFEKQQRVSNAWASRNLERCARGELESASGPGSSVDSTRAVRDFLHDIILRYQVKTIADVGCGDFHWMSLLDLEGLGVTRYVGYDASQAVIEQNQRRFGSRPILSFQHSSILTDAPLQSDLIVARDLLFHLNNKHIQVALAQIKASKSTLFATTTFPFLEEPNRELVANGLSKVENDGATVPVWGYRAINLDEQPFSVEGGLEFVDEGHPCPNPSCGRVVKLYCLNGPCEEGGGTD